MKPYKVLFLGNVSFRPRVLDPLRRVAEVEVHALNRQFLLNQIGRFDAYITFLHVRVDREVLERARRLKIIASPATGTDHLDIDQIKARGIHLITNTTEDELLAKITSTAELVWGLLLAAVRRLPKAHEAENPGPQIGARRWRSPPELSRM